jgi:hypothetical protein
MKRGELDRRLKAVNPVDLDRVDAAPLREAEEEMLAAIVAADPVQVESPSPAPRSHRRAWSVAVAVGVSALVASIAWLGGGLQGGSSSAYGAELIRFAKNSPLILLADWEVGDAIEHSAKEGEMRFFRSGRATAELYWRAGSFQKWVGDRARESVEETAAPVLDSSARVFRYPCCGPGRLDFSALWRENGRVLEFRTVAPSPAAFRERLAALQSVDVDTWLAALPRRVVQAVDRPVTVKAMLRGIPLPPGFEARDVEGAGLMTDRSAIASQVLGAVACGWRGRWLQARSAGDRTSARAAVEALGSVREWPIVREGWVSKTFTYWIEEAAALMPSGRWAIQCKWYR